MIRLLLPLLLFGLLPARLLGAADDLTTHTAPDGTPFYVLGALPSSPRPTLLIFAAEGRKALEESNFSEVGRLLRQEAEYLCLALDLPAHASDQRPDEPPGLKGWRARVDRGEDFVTPFAARVSALLDHLVRTGRTDPARIAIAGTSRGGFMACQVAAREPRIGAVVAFSPVTDLPALTEFSGMEKDPLTLSLAAARLAPRLAGRPVWIVIGNHDRRVDTDACIAFARALAAAQAPGAQPAPVELRVLPSMGHGVPAGSHRQAASWIRSLLSAEEK